MSIDMLTSPHQSMLRCDSEKHYQFGHGFSPVPVVKARKLPSILRWHSDNHLNFWSAKKVYPWILLASSGINFKWQNQQKTISYTFHHPRDFFIPSKFHGVTSPRRGIFFCAAPPEKCHCGRDHGKTTWRHIKICLKSSGTWRPRQWKPKMWFKKFKEFSAKDWSRFCPPKKLMAAETLERARIHVPHATPRPFPKVVVHFGRNSPGISVVFIGFRGGEEWRLLGHQKSNGKRIHLKSCFGGVWITWTNMGLDGIMMLGPFDPPHNWCLEAPRCCSFSTSPKFSSMPFHRDKRSLKDKLQSLQHLVPQRISGRTKQTLPQRRKGRAKGTKIKGLSLLKPCVFNTCHVRFMSWKLSRVCDSNLQRVGVYMLWTTSSKRTAEGCSCIHDMMLYVYPSQLQVPREMTQPLKATSLSTHNMQTK